VSAMNVSLLSESMGLNCKIYKKNTTDK